MYSGPDYYDAGALEPITTDAVIERYGTNPETNDLRHLDIYPLTEQPDYPVDAYVKEGEAYRPIRDYTAQIETLQARIAELEGY